MPNMDFISLIQSLVTTGQAALGDWNVLTARMDRDGLERGRRTAERSLRLLEALAQKTRGNLDIEESDVLTDGIRTVRDSLEAFDAREQGPQA
jgi:Domain of unknown function (DUF1844)